MARSQDFISDVRRVAKALWVASNDSVAIDREYIANGFSAANLPTGEGANAGILPADVVAFIVAIRALNATMTTNAPNISKLL